MLKISKKGELAPSSPIRKLEYYAVNAKASGKKVYHLNIGQPDIETPALALDAIKSYSNTTIEYTSSAGNPSLRNELANYYGRIGIEIEADDIVITAGGSESIFFAFLSTMDEGDEIIIPEPFYANYLAYARMAGVVVKTISSRIEDGFALPPIKEVEKVIGPRTKGILITNPNNPTGYVYSLEELECIADIAKRHSLYIYSDEVYHRFCYDGTKHHSFLNIKGIEENTILFDSMSKTYSECGIRIGALITRNKAVIKTAMKFAMARLCPPALGQVAAEASLKTSEEYFREINQEYSSRRDLVVEKLLKIPGVLCPKPKGAFYVIAKLPIESSEDFCQWLLEEFSINNETLMLAPASGFYNSENMGKDEVRIAYVLNKDNLSKALDILEQALREYIK